MPMHTTLWGSSSTNQRGEYLIEFIIINNLELANRGNKPIFVITSRSEGIDLTLVSNNVRNMIWHAAGKATGYADHRYTIFKFGDDQRCPRGEEHK